MDPIHIKMGGYQPPTSVHNRAAEVFGQELSARLGDRVTFELDGNMPQSQGIRADDLPVLVEAGDLTMCYFASSYLAHRVPELGIFDLPFVVDSREKAYAALDGELGRLLKQKFLDQTGWRALAFWDNGFRHFSNRVRAIRTPDDCKGLSMRSMNSELHQEFFRLLGMEPAYVDVSDLVEAAKSGAIDAQENPLTNTYRFGTHRYHRYITLTGHFFGTGLVLVHRPTYDGWPADVRGAVEAAIAVATRAQRGFAQAEDAEVLAQLDPADNDVAELDAAQRAAFKAAVKPLLDKQREILGADLFALVE